MLIRLADRHGRQNKSWAIVRHQRHGARDNPRIDRRIDAHGQMWTMLLDRADGKHGDDAAHVDG
jgi:hypothetical protein